MEQHFFNSVEDWKAARSGLFTASEIARLMTDAPEGKLSKGAITYVHEKAAEVLTGQSKESFFDYNMNWGVEHEPEAVKEFADRMGLFTNDPEFLYCGGSDPVFYSMSTIAGGSPDLVLPNAIGEVKCPTSPVHLQHLLATAETFSKLFTDKWIQMQANMLFCERPLCYFISYDPRYKIKELQMKIIEIPADTDYQALILKKIILAKNLLDSILESITAPAHSINSLNN